MDRLSESIDEGASQDEIKAIIECLKARSGSYGVERMAIIEYFFKGIVDMSFPSFVKNLFYGAKHNLGLFDESKIAKAEENPKQDNGGSEGEDSEMIFEGSNEQVS